MQKLTAIVGERSCCRPRKLWITIVRIVMLVVLLARFPAGSQGACGAIFESSAVVPLQPPESPPELTPVSDEAREMIRDLCLAVMPEQFEESDDWGKRTKVQSGLHIRMDGLNIRTHRNWKQVNHGTWKKVVVHLVDPKTTFQISVFDLPTEPDQPPRRLITAAARIRVVGEIQQWSYGVRLIGVSAEALADVSFRTEVAVQHSLQKTDDGLKLRLTPTVSASRVQMDGFRLKRFSRMQGAAVREFGEVFEPMLRGAIRRENKSLDASINKQIAKEADRLEVPFDVFSGLFSSE